MDLLPLRRRPLAPDESAVSEIVGSSLILSITVVLFSVIIVWVSTLEGPDEKRFVDLDGSLAVTGAGGTITIIHSGGENLYENLTFIQLFLNDTPSKLNLSVGGVGTTWEMGETWTYNSATIGTNTKVEIRVIEQSSELNQILLSIVLQSGNLAGVNDPAIHMAWSSPDTVTADGATTFCILAYATDVDGNLNTSKAGSVNLAAVGGAAAVTLSDPDGDGTYTTSDQTLAKNVDPGQYKLTLTFTDATGRTDTTKVVLKVRALDLVYTRSDTVIALLEPPSWSSSSTVQATDGGSAYTALAVGDSDNDNDNDTAAGTAGGAVHHWANDGSWTRTVVATPGSQINELIMLDIDGDSKDDILVGTAGGSVILYDAGTAWAATTLDATLGAVHALAVADMDGDTDLDVVVGTASKVELIRNDGGGTWTLQTPIDNAVGAEVHSLALGAFDNTNANNDVVAGTSDAKLIMYRSGGAWSKGNIDGNVGPSANVDAIATADLEGDGDLELVVGTNGSLVIRYERTGTAWDSWSKGTIDSTAGGGIVDIAIAEVNGDGNLDVVVGAGTRLHWYANDHVWSRTTVTTLEGNVGRLAVGEVNYRA